MATLRQASFEHFLPFTDGRETCLAMQHLAAVGGGLQHATGTQQSHHPSLSSSTGPSPGPGPERRAAATAAVLLVLLAGQRLGLAPLGDAAQLRHGRVGRAARLRARAAVALSVPGGGAATGKRSQRAARRHRYGAALPTGSTDSAEATDSTDRSAARPLPRAQDTAALQLRTGGATGETRQRRAMVCSRLGQGPRGALGHGGGNARRLTGPSWARRSSPPLPPGAAYGWLWAVGGALARWRDGRAAQGPTGGRSR
eukprot:scaffold3340_cov63-Phaeocystis_antarctica.AAC.8